MIRDLGDNLPATEHTRSPPAADKGASDMKKTQVKGMQP
jgi:hypothetical protein